LHLTGLLRVPFLDRQYSIRSGALKKPGYLALVIFGASFAVAWTPGLLGAMPRASVPDSTAARSSSVYALRGASLPRYHGAVCL
jgi:cytochrome c biogenesis protein CcdA